MEVHIHRLAGVQQVQRQAVIPVLTVAVFRPFHHVEGSHGFLPRRGGIHDRRRSIHRTCLLAVRFCQHPGHRVVQAVDCAVLKQILGVSRPHVDRLVILHLVGHIGQVFTDDSGITIAVNNVDKTQESAFPCLIAFVIFLVDIGQRVLDRQRIGLIVLMGLIGIPSDVDIILRIVGRKLPKQFCRHLFGGFKYLAALMRSLDMRLGVDLRGKGIAFLPDDIPLAGCDLAFNLNGLRTVHVHHIHGRETADAHLDGHAGSRANGTGIGQHILIPDQLPVEVRLGGRCLRHGQLHGALEAVFIRLAHTTLIHTGMENLRGDADGNLTGLVVILTGKLHVDPVHHGDFAVGVGGQEQVLIIRLRSSLSLRGHRAVLGHP